MQPLAEHVFSLPGLSLHGAVGPAHGPPLLFLHGITRGWRDYLGLIPAFLDQWQIFALDHRGHGRSERAPRGEYLVRDYAADAARCLETHLPAPVVLFGHSLGALVAALVAARLPDRVRGLVLEDPPASALGQRIADSPFLLQFTGTRALLGPSRTEVELTAALAELPVRRPGDGAIVKFRDLRDLDTLRFAAECLQQMDPTVLDPLIAGRWMEGIDWFGALPQITCPTLLLRADPACGGMLDAAEAGRITALLPRCTRVDLEGIGHSIHFTDAERTRRIVQDFFDSLQPQDARP